MGKKKKSDIGHLAQLARRRMLLRVMKDKKKIIYRKRKHKGKDDL